MNILQRIIRDHYEEILYTTHPRAAVMENIDRMLNCGDPSFGGAMYGCSTCGEYKFVPFRCKSRFCPTCGNKYSIDRTTSMSFKLIRCRHRHCVFTIPEELRHFFLEDRSLLNCLFSSVRSVVLRMFYKINRSENFIPGFICVLHTFGRDLKWNPHIHCLISEGGSGNHIVWRRAAHFNYRYLRDSFCTALLNELEQHMGPSFRPVKSDIYKNHVNGFYVYARDKKCDPSDVIKYIGRYLGRPVISTKRIDHYDGDSVTFHYNRHEDEKLIVENIPVMDFIERLVRHIPEKHFKMIRYYGIYARHRKDDERLHRAISRQQRPVYLDMITWRNNILFSFGYDPVKCPCCGKKMLFLELYFEHRPVPLIEMYEKTVGKYRHFP